MAIRFQYNKTSLNNLGKQLKMRQKALPTLQSKESALRLEVRKAKDKSESLIAELDEAEKKYEYLAPLWNEFESGLVSIKDIVLKTVKVAGVKCPELDGIDYEIFEVVWHSPWRMWEHIEAAEYKKDGRYHIIGHVPVLLIPTEKWPGGAKPDMPHFLNDKDNCLANIDLGCALISRVQEDGFAEADGMNAASLCVLDLERYAEGDPEPAFYIR